MGIRENISKSSIVKVSLAILAIVAAVLYAIRFTKSSDAYGQTYFTTDDGQTLFGADMDAISPFDHHGKPAYRAWAFTCDEGKTRFVAYLERYTPQAQARMESAMADYKSGKSHTAPTPGPNDTEVKKPLSDAPWINRADYQKSEPITHVTCPNGGQLELAMP